MHNSCGYDRHDRWFPPGVITLTGGTILSMISVEAIRRLGQGLTGILRLGLQEDSLLLGEVTIVLTVHWVIKVITIPRVETV